MPRARNIKPGFFRNEELAELPSEVRLLFIGLWTLADREGRMEDRPRRIKGELFPYDSFDVDPMLNQLQTSKFIVRYEVSGSRFLQVLNFVKHQDPHYKEKASEIPPPPGGSDLISAVGITRETRARILERDEYRCRHCGSEDYLSIDHVVPASRGGSGEDSNLQVLCLKCNGAKGNKLPGETKGARKSKHNDTSLRTRRELDSTLDQGGAEHPGSVPLIPDSLIPDSLIPDSLNPESGKKTARKRAASTLASQDALVAAGFDAQTAAEFIEHKASVRAPLTDRAWADHCREAAKAGWTPLQAAEKVMARSWKGFEAKYVAGESPAPSRRADAGGVTDLFRRGAA